MEFSKKKFSNTKSLVLSERPLYAMQFEERIASLIPAMEVAIDSFEEYSSAYEHCSKNRTVGLFFLHLTDSTSIPMNAIDELAAPFESINSTAGLYVIASDKNSFAEAYTRFNDSGRLLGISLESDIQLDSAFKKTITEAVLKFNGHQVELAAPKVELDFFIKAARKFENLDLLHQMTNLLTSKLDRDWYDDLLVEAGPALMSLPDNQKWILNNSPSLVEVFDRLKPFQEKTISELLNSKDSLTVARAVMLAFKLYETTKNGTFEETLNESCKGTNAFSPTLKKLISSEMKNFLTLYSGIEEQKSA